MRRIRLKALSVGLFALCLLFWLGSDAAYAASGRIYYDPHGNIISAEEYRKLTGQPQPPGATPESVNPPEAEAVQPEEKSAPEALPAKTESQLPDGTSKDWESPPATEKEAGKSIPPGDKPVQAGDEPVPAGDKPVPAGDKPVPATSSADLQPEAEKVTEESLYDATITSETLFRVFQRDTDMKKDANVLPLYEYLQIDLNTPAEGLSLHTSGWGRHDFDDSKFYHDNPDGELLYGYIEYNRSDYGFNLKLGRQHIFDGIINSSIDGLGIKSTLTPYFNVSLYGGSPVALSSDNGRSGDSFLGGRIAAHLGSRYELGLSYKLENSDGVKDGEVMGVDLFLMLPGDVYLRGQSSYNLDTKGWGEHFLEAGLDISDFHFRPIYERYNYTDFFNQKDNSANPFRFLADSNEILTVVGGDVIWRRFAQVDLGVKLTHYSYDQRNDDAMYYEGNLTWYVNSLTQVGGQIGRMDGGTSETAYYQTRAFFYWNRPLGSVPLGFVTGDITYVGYDAEIFGQDSALSLSLGTGVKFFNDSLEIKLSGDYNSDPYFESDLRGMLTIKYQKDINSGAGRDPLSGMRQ